MIATLCKTALCFLSVGVLVTAHAQEPLKVDTQGVTAKILYEAPIDGGHLPELKGKYKMRITEITIAPGGHVDDHNHLGPGIRQMTVGAMEYLLPDKTMIYRAGDFLFETGGCQPPRQQQDERAQYASAVRDSACGPEGGLPDCSQGQTPSIGFGGDAAQAVQDQAQRDDSRYMAF
jgi:quercetin dioxygenase-like cupin family protein